MSIANPKTAGTATITYIVMSVLNRLRDYSMRHYSFLEQIVIEGYTDLNLWHLNNIEVVYYKMSDAKSVPLPPDFVDYCKVGIPIGGKIRVITRNPNILLPRTYEDTDPEEEVGHTDADNTSSGAIFFVDHFRNGQFVAGLYGLPGGLDHTEWNIDWERRQLVFGGSIPRTEIVLEYISSGINLSGGTIIPREAAPALRQYALWQIIENDHKVSANEKERKKQQYEEQVEALRSFQSTFTIDDYKRSVWRSTHQSIKR